MPKLTFKNIFYIIKNKIFLRIARFRYHTTEKAVFAAYYLVNKYINCTTPNDYNAHYETLVDTIAQKLTQRKDIVITPAELREYAALYAIVRLAYFADNKKREKIYSYIKDSGVREMVQRLVRRALVII